MNDELGEASAAIGSLSATKQQQQQQQQQQRQQQQQHQQQQLQSQHQQSKTARPLSISSISSAASSGSSSSSNSSSSSGIQSSLTRNSSLNYSQEFRKQSYLASIESLDSAQQLTACSSSSCVAGPDKDGCPNGGGHPFRCAHELDHNACIELALKSLQLNQHHNQFRDVSSAVTRAAVLAAGESQRRSFGSSPPGAGGGRATRINRSFHASLRYDKHTAYRIHMMTNARALQYRATQSGRDGASAQADTMLEDEHCCCGPTVDRSSASSASSDSDHARPSFREPTGRRPSCQGCRCFQLTRIAASPSLTSTNSSASLTDASTTSDKESSPGASGRTPPKSPGRPSIPPFAQKAATLDGSHSQRTDASTSTSSSFCNNSPLPQSLHQHHQLHCRHHQQVHHHPDCTYSNRPKRASAKLQQSPSSVSSHSNTSSLFRDDGFEDDLNSTTSEHCSTVYHQHQHLERHRPVFYHQNQNHHISLQNHHIEGELGNSPSITQRVVTEIIETERSYVDDLEQIVTGYLCNLRDTLEQQKELFSNLEEVYKFNKDFLFQLEECYLNPGAVAACFVENGSKFDVYTHYCTMYPQVVSTLTQLMADPITAQVLKDRQLELGQSLPLGAYLLKPVQRILKYHILFKSLIKYTADDETVVEKERELINEAFSVMTNIACHINEMKKKHEHSIRVQELQGVLCGWEGPDLTTLGELILEDSFKLFNRQKSCRHLLLFDNVLLITKKKRDGSLCYKGHIECSNLMLIETIEGQPLVFNTVPFDNPKALCAFQADNLERKRDWCLQMKEVIIKSFEVKIPTHVRDLLMSLTKGNNADVNASAGATTTTTTSKTSTSETAKAIRAPNYLDRKRNKDKKKQQQ